MILNLFWKDNDKNTYLLGKLYKKDKKYCFDIDEQGLKEATHKGCFGIGELNLLYKYHESEELFDFFKRRIPSKNNPNIEEILKEVDMLEYDEMELLQKTKGILNTDKYFLELLKSNEQ